MIETKVIDTLSFTTNDDKRMFYDRYTRLMNIRTLKSVRRHLISHKIAESRRR
jgi:hypothetical protein